jgi:hypothetical protein
MISSSPSADDELCHQLFFFVWAMKLPSCGTTFVLLHLGRLGFAFSHPEMVMVSSKGFRHFSQRNRSAA